MSKKISEFTRIEKLLSIIVFIAVIVGLYNATCKIFAVHNKEAQAYEMIKANSRHIKIDDLPGGNAVYMILYKKDTLGVVAVKD